MTPLNLVSGRRLTDWTETRSLRPGEFPSAPVDGDGWPLTDLHAGYPKLKDVRRGEAIRWISFLILLLLGAGAAGGIETGRLWP